MVCALGRERAIYEMPWPQRTYGAEVTPVWRLVRRYRELIHEHAEQLSLPLTPA